jgi:hypothetical protein
MNPKKLLERRKKMKHCPECGRFMRQVDNPGFDPNDAPCWFPDFECECGFAIFDTADKEKDTFDAKAEYEQQTGFRPYL